MSRRPAVTDEPEITDLRIQSSVGFVDVTQQGDLFTVDRLGQVMRHSAEFTMRSARRPDLTVAPFRVEQVFAGHVVEFDAIVKEALMQPDGTWVLTCVSTGPVTMEPCGDPAGYALRKRVREIREGME